VVNVQDWVVIERDGGGGLVAVKVEVSPAGELPPPIENIVVRGAVPQVVELQTEARPR